MITAITRGTFFTARNCYILSMIYGGPGAGSNPQLQPDITLRPDPCPCGSPMAIATVVEETFGVQRFQVIQTAPATLRVRLEVMPGTDDRQVWESVARRLREYLAAQGLSSASVEKADEPPMRDQVSGKFRRVWAAMS